MARRLKTQSKLDPQLEIQVPDLGSCIVQTCKATYEPARWGTGRHSNWILCRCSNSTDHKAWWIKHESEADSESRWVDIGDFVNLLRHPCYISLHRVPSCSLYAHTLPIHICIYKATAWTCLDPHRYDWLGQILSQLLSLRTPG